MMSQKRNKPSPPEESSAASIDDLPEEVLLHIIAFLPLIDAVKTSAVTRPWRNLWHSVPDLEFNMETFHSIMFEKELDNEEVYELFSDLIVSALRRPEHLPLRKFKLQMCHDYGELESPQYRNSFGSWLQQVIAANVVELDLDFDQFDPYTSACWWDMHDYSELPNDFQFEPMLFFDLIKTSNSIKVLKLTSIEIEFPKESLRLESITEVKLESFHSSDKEIADFIASCVNLETLSLSQGSGFYKLNIVSQRLECLKLNGIYTEDYWDVGDEDCGSVEICASSLTSLNLSDVFHGNFALRMSSPVVEAEVELRTKELSSLTGVERLTIQNKFQPEDGFFPESVIFHNLRHVKLWIKFSSDELIGLESMFRQCPQLTTMVLDNVGTINRPNLKTYFLPKVMPEVIFQVPHLSLVEIKAFRETKMVMHIVDLLKKHGVVLEKIVAFPQPVKGKSPQPPFVL